MNYKELISKYPIHHCLGGSDTSGGLEQNANELEMLCKFIDEKNIKSYLEIGIAHGYLLRFMKEEMKLKAKGITLAHYDTHNGLNVIYSKSQDISINSDYDLIFVDGSHTYLDVTQDYLNYKKNCTYMAFHDICGKRGCEDVYKFWNEIKPNHEYWEFIAENKEQQSGIGIIKI